jgi:UDP-N-acetylglucosamine 1-carboxyvinyltransferase
VQGSKNCFNHLGAVALAGDGLELRLDGVPSISDRDAVTDLLTGSGVDVLRVDDALLLSGRPTTGDVDPVAAGRLRVSICYAAALAANVGRAVCPYPGGDAFTARPIDLHVRVLRAAEPSAGTPRAGCWPSGSGPGRGRSTSASRRGSAPAWAPR